MSLKESQAHGLLDVVQGPAGGSADVDRKISEFTTIKAQIKHQTVSPDAITPLFDACRIAVASPNSSLASQALSCLGHLIRRVSIQEPARIRSQAHHVVPLVIEKLGDAKDRNKTIALTTIIEIYKNAPNEVEKCMKDTGFGNKNPRIRQESIKWLAQIHSSYPRFAFKSYTPFLMTMLEDSSELVREAAKEVVIELFANAPDNAKSDVKRELQKRGIRKGIATYIIARLALPVGTVEEAPDNGADPSARPAAKSGVAGSVADSMASSAYVASMPGNELEELEPLYVNTNRELEEIFDDMAEPFDGRESEHNWVKREESSLKIRRMLRGNAYRDFQTTFLAKIKSYLDGILKIVNSLRTTLSTSGGQLIKDLALIVGPGLDPFVEILLSNMVKLCANTKKITSQLGNLVVATILTHVSYHMKLLQHIHLACQDKNVQPRSYAAGWIQAILETHIDHKAQIEHGGGLDVLVKCVKRGLADANPGVRENMRNTYWKFGVVWPDHAATILDGLDNNSRKLLEKVNPNASMQAKGTASLRAPGLTRSATAPARPSIRDAILAQKRSKVNLKPQHSSVDVADRPISPLPPGPTGLSSAPVRRLKTRPGPEKQPMDVVSTAPGYGRAASPAFSASQSSRVSPGRGSESQTPPLSPPLGRMARGVTPGRAQSSVVGNSRKLTVLEQLNHTDWKVRVEGIIVVACILAKRIPPNYEGQKMPTLPPTDVFAPTLAKLLNDPQPEVVENVVAPEVLAELAKVVPMEQIIPKVLLLSEGDDERHAHPINTSTMPALKKLLTDAEAADLLFQVIQSMNSSGVFTRKVSLVSLKPTEKRKITHGCLLWMNELVENHASGVPNEFFSDRSNYKLILNRFIQMLSAMKSPNLIALAAVLKNLQRLDGETFAKTLTTFEPSIAKELRKAWGVNIEDDAESIIVEEKVADVKQVLGSIPEVGGIIQAPSRGRGIVPTGDLDGLMDINMPPALRPVTPPSQTAQDHENLKNLPPLPSSPERVDTNISPRRTARQDENPSIKVYQDPIPESNGAAATSSTPERSTISAGKEWQNHRVGKLIGTNTNLPKTPGDSARLLETLIERLQTRDIDTQAFRKLIGIVRENPVREPLQEANGEDLYDIWQGGAVFQELLTSLLEYLAADDIKSSRATDLRAQGLLVFKQLLSKATPYFARHEAEVLSILISIRGKYPLQSQITTAIEEISEEYMQVADPKAGIDAILNITQPVGNPSLRPSTQGWCMSLSCLADLVRASRPLSLETQFARLGELAVKSLEDEDSEVRRSCVTMCIEMHSKLNDDQRLFDDILRGLKSGHQNLLAYYFAKREGEKQ